MESPSLDEFLVAAREDNPDVPERALKQYWNQKYGHINPATLPSWETFKPAAITDNPGIPETQLRHYWEEKYGVFGAPEKDTKVGLLGTVAEGAKSAGRSVLATAQTLMGDEAGAVETAQREQAAPKDTALARLQADIAQRIKSLGNDPGWLEQAAEFGKAVLSNPKGAALQIAEQTPNTVAALGSAGAGAWMGGAAGAAVGGPVGAAVGATIGGIAGLFGANTILETGAKAKDAAADQSFGPTEQAQVLREGATKGAVVTGFDVLTFGFTNWVTGTLRRAVERATIKTLTDAGIDVADRAALTAARQNPDLVARVQRAQQSAYDAVNTLSQRAARGVGKIGVDAMGEGAGEYLGEYAATGEADKMEAIIEAFAGLSQTAGELAITHALERKRLEQATFAGTPAEGSMERIGVENDTVGIDEAIQRAFDLAQTPTPGQKAATQRLLDRVRAEDEARAAAKPYHDLEAEAEEAQRRAEEQAALQAAKPAIREELAQIPDQAPRTGVPTPEVAGPDQTPTYPDFTVTKATKKKPSQILPEGAPVPTARGMIEAVQRTKGAAPPIEETPTIVPGTAYTPRPVEPPLPTAAETSGVRTRRSEPTPLKPVVPWEGTQPAGVPAPSEAAKERAADLIRDTLRPTGIPERTKRPEETPILGAEREALDVRRYPKPTDAATEATRSRLSQIAKEREQLLSRQPAKRSERPDEGGDATPQTAPPASPEPSGPSLTDLEQLADRKGISRPVFDALVKMASGKTTAELTPQDRQKVAAALAKVGTKTPEPTTPTAKKETPVQPVGPAATEELPRSVARDETAVPQSQEQAVSPVRSEGDNRVSAVAGELPSVPGRRGAEASTGPRTGSDRQQQGVRAGERAVDDARQSGEEPSQQPVDRVPGQEAVTRGLGEGNGATATNTQVPNRSVSMERGAGLDDARRGPTEDEPNADVSGPNETDGSMGEGSRPELQDVEKQNPSQLAGREGAYPTDVTGQTSIPVPPPTIGSRPIIGREAQPEEAPLFSKAAQEPEAEQTEIPTEETPDTPTEILAKALRTAADQIEGKKIEDVGEKIGGARKDLAEKTGPKGKAATTDERPGWMRRYAVTEIVGGQDVGKWTIRDTKDLDWAKRPRQVGPLFNSKEEAERAIPMAAFARNHRVYRNSAGRYEIMRKIGDRKLVKVVPEDFETEDAAKQYVAQHVAEIIETKTSFGEEILPRPDVVRRTGPDRRNGRNVGAEDFRQTFGFRAVEFGNWNNQTERQEVMNHAYDGLLDLAELLNIPPQAIGLNGELALAFGARGHGLQGARAHYERDYGVINLTKMQGAGSLSHEWFHSLDHYFARQDTKASSEKQQNERGDLVYKAQSRDLDYASYGFRKTGSGMREALREKYTQLIQTMFTKAEQYVEDAAKVERWVGETRNDLKSALDEIRDNSWNGLSKTITSDYVKRHKDPASAEQLAEWDTIVAKLLAGELLETKYTYNDTKTRRRLMSGRWTNDALEQLSAIYKAVRGRSGFQAEGHGPLDKVRDAMTRYSQRLKMLAEAQQQTTKTKRVPTEYAREAKSIDQGRTEAYWMTNHEMAARAFEAYVEDKLKAEGRRSDFLQYQAHGAVLTPWGWKKPYPEGEERKAINKAFDAFVEELQTRETDQGIALYQQAEPSGLFADPPTHEALAVQAAIEGKTVVEAARFLAETAPSDASRVIAHKVAVQLERLQAAGMRFELHVAHLNDRVPAPLIGTKGLTWLPDGSDTTQIWLQGADVTGYVGTSYETALHELLHGATQAAVYLGNRRGAVGTPLGQAVTELYAVTNAIIRHFNARAQANDLTPFERAIFERRANALRDPNEVLAWAFTNPQMQAYLESIPYERTSLWTRFVQAVRAFLGLQAERQTALSEVLRVGEQLLDTPANEIVTGIRDVWMPTQINQYDGLLNEQNQPDERGIPDSPTHVHWVTFDPAYLNKVKATLDRGTGFVIRRVYNHPTKGDLSVLKIESHASYNDLDLDLNSMSSPLRRLSSKPRGLTSGLAVASWEDIYGQLVSDRSKLDTSQAGGPSGLLNEQVALPRQTAVALRGVTDLTPAQTTALERVHGKPLTWHEKLNSFKTDWKTRLTQGLFDQYAPIFNYDQKAYMLARLSKGGDGTLEALLLYGKPYVDADGAYQVDTNGGFAKVLAGLKGEHDRFLEWVAALRADRLKKVGLENLYSEQDIQTLKTLNQGTMKDGSSRPITYEKALLQLNEWNAAMTKLAVDSGLIDHETAATFKDVPYVPFYRLQEEGLVTGFAAKPGLVNQYAWKRLKGGTQHLNDDLLANVLQNWSHLITAAARNRAAKETLMAAEKAGVAQAVPSGAPGKGLVHYRDAGREKTFAVSDPALLDAITALHYAGMGTLGKPFAAMKRALTFGVTVNPAFKIRNLIRDTIQAIGTADLSYNPFENLKTGFKALDEPKTRASLMAGGGMIRFGTMLDGNNADRARTLIEQGVHPQHILDSPNKIERFWKQWMLPVFEAYQELGDKGEQVNRAALYQQMRAKGLSHLEASYMARDLMDFSLMGKWEAVRILAQVVPFANARLQGLRKLGVAATQDYRRLGTVLGAVSLASLALLLAYQDDPDWERREEFDRNNFWWFKIGDVAFRLPKPFEIGAVGTLAERGAELLISDEMTGARFAQQLGALVSDQLSMNPTPQLLKPLLDLYANKDSFTDKPIETMGMERLRKEDRVTDRTSELARLLGQLGLPDPTQLAMGRWESLSPVQLDHVVHAYFGWLGTSITTALDYGIRPLVTDGEKPAMKLKDVFLVGSFVESLPASGSRYVTQLYEQSKEIEQAYGSFREAMKRGDYDRAREIQEDEGDKLRQYKRIERVKRTESEIATRIKQIERSPTLSGDEKRELIDRLKERKHLLARSVAMREVAATP